jgi:hypothetical protein
VRLVDNSERGLAGSRVVDAADDPLEPVIGTELLRRLCPAVSSYALGTIGTGAR